MRIVILVLFLMSFAYAQPPIEPGVSHELAKWRAAHYSDVRYKLNLTLEKMSPVLKGTMEIRLKVRDAGNGGRGDAVIVLDWRRIRGYEEKSTVSNVSINGASVQSASFSSSERDKSSTLSFEESNEHLIFRDGVVLGENVIKLDFTSPILTSGSAITRYIDKEDGSEYIYSLFVPSDASTAFPVFDQPDLKARFKLFLDVPVSWGRPVSNTAVEQTAMARCIPPPGHECSHGYFFEETKPISTYLFAFAAGPWQQVSVPSAVAGGGISSDSPPYKGGVAAASADGVVLSSSGNSDLTQTKRENHPAEAAPLLWKEGSRRLPSASAGGTDTTAGVSTSIYVRKSQLAKFQPHAAEVFRLNREGIKFLESYFDYKFPFPKYDLVLIPEFPFGGMEHAGATFLREAAVIFPQEPTKNDYISRANVIFHEAAHQWFGDTVTMKWFDDLWLKEGFAEFMAYKTLEKVMPEYNAWKVFYERNKQSAYLTDSTRGTTPIYQEIANLSAAKSAYGNIVYRKAPSFLKQAEFYIGPDKFQTAVRAFLKKHEFGNAGWEDLVKEFEIAGGKEDLAKYWANTWIKQRGVPIFDLELVYQTPQQIYLTKFSQRNSLGERTAWLVIARTLTVGRDGYRTSHDTWLMPVNSQFENVVSAYEGGTKDEPIFVFPNYQDYGYGIFLLDDKSRDYILKNIQNEKDDFLRSMMWGSLWDSVRESEFDPKEYVELVLRVQSASSSSLKAGEGRDKSRTLNADEDETTTASLLNRVSTAMTYYFSDKQRDEIAPRLEAMLIDKMRTAPTLGQRITYYRALLNVASTEKARSVLKEMLRQQSVPHGSAGGSSVADVERNPQSTIRNPQSAEIPLKTKDRFDIVTKLASLNDPDAEKLLADLEKSETSDDAKRYAYAARAAFPKKETKEKYWNDFTTNKEISESWIEAAFGPFNSVRHADLTMPYLERALKELPNHKRNRKIFFVNGWLAAFVGGQRSEEALNIVNKFLADNPELDRDLRLKILENVDLIERAVKIRAKFASS